MSESGIDIDCSSPCQSSNDSVCIDEKLLSHPPNVNSVPCLSDGHSPQSATASTSTSPSSPAVGEDGWIVAKVRKYTWEPPLAANVTYSPHAGEGSQYLRDFILGVNDGIVSTFLIVVGVAASGADTTACLLTAISSAIAGSMAMGLGEYIATKSQAEVYDGELNLEKEHFKYHRDIEISQVRDFMSRVGLRDNLLEAVVAEISRSDENLFRCMEIFEFGQAESVERHPVKAMFMSGRLFFLGSIPTIIPFIFVKDDTLGLILAAVLVLLSLFAVGAYKTRTTRGVWWKDGLENFLFGGFAGGISYIIGYAFGQFIH